MDYGDLRRSELFTFFRLSEQSRSEPSDAGIVTISLKPGGFQEFIDMQVQIDRTSLVREASLLMDRKWVGDIANVNPFAKDITKTFLSVFVPAEDADFVKDIVHTIWNLKGTQDKVYYLTQPSEEEESYDPQVLKAQRVYLGEDERLEMVMPSSELVIENNRRDSKERLRLTISCF
jgi:hypothetical protein